MSQTGPRHGTPAAEADPAPARRLWPLRFWGGALAGGWALLALLMLNSSLWEMPSYLPGALPGLYDPLIRMFPAAWTAAPREGGPGRTLAVVLYLVLAAALCGGYLAAIRAAARPPGTGLRPILLGGLLFGALAAAWPGLLSSDVYFYAAQAKMQAVYGLNPLVQPPSAMGVGEPWRAWAPSQQLISPYGPLWHDLSGALGWLAEAMGGDRTVYLLAFRALNLVLLALGTWLVWDIGRVWGWSAERRAAATVAFAWCPLGVIELVGNGHNDALLVLAILGAIRLHAAGRWPLAVAALVGAGLVKLPGWFLLPAYVLLLLRASPDRGAALRRLGASAGIAAALVLAAYAPYADPDLPRAVAGNPVAGLFAASPAALVRQVVVDGIVAVGGGTARAALGAVRWPLWYGAVAGWALLATVFTLRVRDFPGLLRAWGAVLLSYLLLGAVWFQPWYSTWLLPLIALLPRGTLRTALLLLALGSTLDGAIGPYLPGDTTTNLRHYYVPLVIFGPVLAYLALAARERWRGRRGLDRLGRAC